MSFNEEEFVAKWNNTTDENNKSHYLLMNYKKAKEFSKFLLPLAALPVNQSDGENGAEIPSHGKKMIKNQSPMQELFVFNESDADSRDSKIVSPDEATELTENTVISFFCGCGGLDLGFLGGFDYIPQIPA